MSSSSSPPDHAGSRRLPILIGVFAVALALRGFAIADDFWFDECWNWSRLWDIDWFADILFKAELKHDNNHPLVTLWMYLVGRDASGIVYRLPSLIAGLVTVYLVMDPRRGTWGMAIPGAMFAVSFWMVLFSTEARGYALAVCFVLGAYRLLENSEADHFAVGRGRCYGYWALMLAAVASHLIAVHFLLGAIAWTAVKVFRHHPVRVGVKHLLWLHGVPVLFVVFLWLVFVRGMIIGGASGIEVAWMLQNLCAWTTGAPNEWLFAWPAMLVLVGCAGCELYRRAREGSPEWLLWVVGVLVSPVVGMLFVSHTVVVARYHLIGAVFTMLYAGRFLTRRHLGSPSVLSGALLVVLAFLVGNLVRDIRFVEGGGRGQYSAAVRHMSRLSGPEFWIGSDFDLRNGTLLRFHHRAARPGQRLRFMQDAPNHPEGPDWFIIHSLQWAESQGPPEPTGSVVRLRSHLYDLVDEYPHYGPSGFTWRLFRKRPR